MELRNRNGASVVTFYWRRMMSTSMETAVADNDQKKGNSVGKTAKSDSGAVVPSYWGIDRSKIKREDGSQWPWNCFMPWETYKSNTSIDLTKHHKPTTFLDKVAYWTETVAAVPGMVGGMLLHLKSLRKFKHSGGWIKALLEEAWNERMHLMTMVELVQPMWYKRLLVLAVQGVFFNAYFLLYLLSSKLCHRITGYLEEEAIHSYTEFLEDIKEGKMANVPAPAVAIEYWRLPKDATLEDVITVIRADEAHHRDVNHFASVSIHSLLLTDELGITYNMVSFANKKDQLGLFMMIDNPHLINNQLHFDYYALSYSVVRCCNNKGLFGIQDIHIQGKELKEEPAPLGYH